MAYCSRDCQKLHRHLHKYVCKEFPLVKGKNVLHTTGSWEKHIAVLRKRAAQLPKAEHSEPIFNNLWVCNTCKDAHPGRLTDCKCGYISYCSKKCAKADKTHKETCTQLGHKRQLIALTRQRFLYPMTLHYALGELRDGCFGNNNRSHKDLTSIVVHVITSCAMLETFAYEEDLMETVWELGFVQLLPKLKQVNIVFIVQGNAFTRSLAIDTAVR